MYTTLDFLVLFNGRGFIVAASPGLKLHTTDEADTAHMVASYRRLASRDTSFFPTSFKSPQSLRPIRARDTAYLKSYATDLLITPCLSPCFVEGCWQGKNSVALINVAINFGYEYFCFVIYFSEIFLVKTFFHNFPQFIFFNFLPKFFPEIFFQNFFSKFFFPKFFFDIFFSNFFLTIFFPKFFLLRALLSMPPRLQRQNGLYVSMLWKIWFTASGRNWTFVLCDKVLLFGGTDKVLLFEGTDKVLLTSHSTRKVQILPRNA